MDLNKKIKSVGKYRHDSRGRELVRICENELVGVHGYVRVYFRSTGKPYIEDSLPVIFYSYKLN